MIAPGRTYEDSSIALLPLSHARMSLPHRLWRLARHSIRRTSPFGSRGTEVGTNSVPSEESVRREAAAELDEFLGVVPPHASAQSQPHPLTRQYAMLGVSVGADEAVINRAWRRLVLENHPDRYAGDPAAARAATDRLREINQAHAELIAWLKREKEP